VKCESNDSDASVSRVVSGKSGSKGARGNDQDAPLGGDDCQILSWGDGRGGGAAAFMIYLRKGHGSCFPSRWMQVYVSIRIDFNAYASRSIHVSLVVKNP
jgi:hypothetical protein